MTGLQLVSLLGETAIHDLQLLTVFIPADIGANTPVDCKRSSHSVKLFNCTAVPPLG